MGFVITSVLFGLATYVSAQRPGGPGGGGGSPAYTLYQAPLPIPELAQPDFSITTADGRTVQSYSVTIESFQKQIYPNLGSASMIGYNGTAPGPMFRIDRGTETIVRFLNKGTRASVVHLHGSYNHAPWDGWADDEMQPNQWKDYYWPNLESGRAMWYHDHADTITAVNAYFGQSGVYILHDPAEDSLGLPSGNYDVPLAITDKTYNSNGGLVSPAGNTFNFFGDVIHVNGQPWPYMNVEPRKYRFRLYDMSLSRAYDLRLQNAGSNINYQVIASDSGLFGAPVTTSTLTMAMGERYEIVVDFSAYQGKNITMVNAFTAAGTTAFTNTDKVMQFVVGNSVSDPSNNQVPSVLNSNIDYPTSRSTIDHVFRFQLGGNGGATWTINGVPFSDVNNRVLAKPPQGAVERWQLVHAGGPAVHPVHIHMVNLQVMSRTGGSRGVLPYEKAGLKDTVTLEPGETVEVLAMYGPWDGLYMFHCHNLVHEDNAMMAAFNVSLLTSLGYPETVGFNNPNDARYKAKPYTAKAFKPLQIKKLVKKLAALNPYSAASSLMSAEKAYYAATPFTGEPAKAKRTAPPVARATAFVA